jgi:hypothetical protein
MSIQVMAQLDVRWTGVDLEDPTVPVPHFRLGLWLPPRPTCPALELAKLACCQLLVLAVAAAAADRC